MSVVESKIKIESSIFNAIRKRAKDEGTTENKIINDILKEGIKGKEDKKTVFERIERLTNGKAEILNKDTYNPNKSNSIKDIIEVPEGFDPVKAVEEANVRKCE